MVEGPSEKAGFWHRQFGPTVTQPQIIFDIVFGLFVPILCFVLDPIVFRGLFFGPFLPDYQAFAFLFSGLQITLLGLWILSGPGWQPWNRLMSGTVLCGGCFYLIVGLAIAPLDGNGMFGFTPFLTALVFLRNSRRAFRAGNDGAESLADAVIPASGILLGAGLTLPLSVAIHSTASRAANEIVEGDSQHAIFAARRLMPLRFFAGSELNQIANAYRVTSDEKRKELLKFCFREITGDSIEKTADILRHDRATRQVAPVARGSRIRTDLALR